MGKNWGDIRSVVAEVQQRGEQHISLNVSHLADLLDRLDAERLNVTHLRTALNEQRETTNHAERDRLERNLQISEALRNGCGQDRTALMERVRQLAVELAEARQQRDGYKATLVQDAANHRAMAQEIEGLRWERIAQDVELTRLTAALAAKDEALRVAEHELATLHGLTATDGTSAYSDALYEGCDPSGAWDCFRDGLFGIDTSKALSTVQAALALTTAACGPDSAGSETQPALRLTRETQPCQACAAKDEALRAYAIQPVEVEPGVYERLCTGCDQYGATAEAVPHGPGCPVAAALALTPAGRVAEAQRGVTIGFAEFDDGTTFEIRTLDAAEPEVQGHE